MAPRGRTPPELAAFQGAAEVADLYSDPGAAAGRSVAQSVSVLYPYGTKVVDVSCDTKEGRR
ncbi:MAG: hypothetical protein M3304_05505 [Actinomycetota bacterium]|nr:hypothetical protein [Actinomycetota bacterium]